MPDKAIYYCECGWQKAYPSAARVNCPRCKQRATEAPGGEPPPKTPRRRIVVAAKKKCKHLGERRSANGEQEVLKVLCQTCRGVNNIMQPVYGCDLHKRCLPEFKPVGEAYDLWFGSEAKGIERRFEADFYHVCHGCRDQDLVEISPPASESL